MYPARAIVAVALAVTLIAAGCATRSTGGSRASSTTAAPAAAPAMAGRDLADDDPSPLVERFPPAPRYSETYRRDPDRPSPSEARAQAERDFDKMVNPKVLAMLRLLNEERRRNGLSTVVLEPRLMAAALREARDMAAHGHVSHEATDGSQMEDRIADVQYYFTKVAENIAATKPTAAETFRQWVTSPRHHEQMMLSGATQAGIAYAYNPKRPRGGAHLVHYWVLLVARPHPFFD